MQLYVNWYDRERLEVGDNPTIGLILCTQKNDAVVRYVVAEQSQQIFASPHRFLLPAGPFRLHLLFARLRTHEFQHPDDFPRRAPLGVPRHAGASPAIVLDAGGGLDARYWDTLVPELAKRTGREIITYDRAGFGTSDEVSGPWNLQSATDDLANGLAKLGATQGVIMVSHSLAGEIATELAIQHPHWLAGAVLVDANVPDFFKPRQSRR